MDEYGYLYVPKQCLSDIINESGNPQYKYYHMNAESIVISMKKVLKLVKSDEQKTADEL